MLHSGGGGAAWGGLPPPVLGKPRRQVGGRRAGCPAARFRAGGGEVPRGPSAPPRSLGGQNGGGARRGGTRGRRRGFLRGWPDRDPATCRSPSPGRPIPSRARCIPPSFGSRGSKSARFPWRGDGAAQGPEKVGG